MTTRRIKYGSPQKLFVNNKELFSVHAAQITIYSLFVFCYNKTEPVGSGINYLTKDGVT